MVGSLFYPDTELIVSTASAALLGIRTLVYISSILLSDSSLSPNKQSSKSFTRAVSCTSPRPFDSQRFHAANSQMFPNDSFVDLFLD